MTESGAWAAFGASLALLGAFEIRALWIARRAPERVARTAHARMRVSWVDALSRKEGFEIVAVQALRNSLMSATIAASTAALALMGSVSLAGLSITEGIGRLDAMQRLALRPVLEGLLMLVLFASYVCSAMAMRFFNHASYVMSMPVGSPERKQLNPLASDYVERAGLFYSWGLRFFLMVAPLVAGIVTPWAMPPMTVMLVMVLWAFDRPARAAAPGMGP